MLNLSCGGVVWLIVCLILECKTGNFVSSADAPLLTNLRAPLIADLDISHLAGQIRNLIKEEVQNAVSGLNISSISGFKDHPAFFVTLQQHPFTLHGIDDVVKFDGIKVNIGGGYNRQTGYFVCPKAGVYHFSAMILGNHGHVVHYQLNKNNSPYVIGYSKMGTADSSTVSVVAKLEVGDRIFIKHRYRNEVEQIFGLDHSSFSGFFLHE